MAQQVAQRFVPTPTPSSVSSAHDLFSQSVHTDDIDVDGLMNPGCGISDIEVMDSHFSVLSNNSKKNLFASKNQQHSFLRVNFIFLCLFIYFFKS